MLIIADLCPERTPATPKATAIKRKAQTPVQSKQVKKIRASSCPAQMLI